MIKEDLAALNIKPRRVLLRALADGGQATRSRPPSRNCAQRASSSRAGCRKPKGHDDGEWEDREQTLFKSTAFGDDVDRALMKSDGSYTYFAADMAYHHNKLARGFLHLINVFGADHAGYIDPRARRR